MKHKIDKNKETIVLAYLQYHRGRQMRGEGREMMYDIYRFFKQDRTSKVCSCLDQDTFKKVDNFINSIEWSEETRSSERMKEVLPNLYLEPIQIEEQSTQPIDMDEVLKGMRVNVVEEKAKKPTKRRTRKKKE